MAGIIDFSTHIFPKRYLKELPEQPNNFLAMGPQFFDLDFRIKLMDKFNIEKQVITLSSQGLARPGTDFVKLVRAGNDGIADIVKEKPDRFLGMGTFSHIDSPEIVEELERSVSVLGFRGAMIHTTQDGKPLDSKEFDPFFSKVEKLGVPLLLHPRSWNYYPWIAEHKIDMVLGWPFDTSVAVMRLLMSGFFDRHPTIKLVTHHAGGMLPFFSTRIQGMYLQGEEYKQLSLQSSSRSDPMSYLKNRIYCDTAVYGSSDALSCALAMCGTEKMIFGTDYPFGPESGEKFVRDTIESVSKLGSIDDKEKELVFAGNAQRLFGIS